MTFTVSTLEDADTNPPCTSRTPLPTAVAAFILHIIPIEQMSAKELSISLAKRREAVTTNRHTHLLKVLARRRNHRRSPVGYLSQSSERPRIRAGVHDGGGAGRDFERGMG
jgi:hypothetical protein